MLKKLEAAIQERKALQANLKKIVIVELKKPIIAPVRQVKLIPGKNGLLKSVEELLTPTQTPRVANG